MLDASRVGGEGVVGQVELSTPGKANDIEFVRVEKAGVETGEIHVSRLTIVGSSDVLVLPSGSNLWDFFAPGVSLSAERWQTRR